MSTEKILKTLEDKKYKFVDLRFCDTLGKEQHVSLPVSAVDEDLFEEGKMFDGSSIAGWKGINESDMILMPEAATAVLDPFTDDATVNLRCDILEPSTMEGYERDPRSVTIHALELREIGLDLAQPLVEGGNLTDLGHAIAATLLTRATGNLAPVLGLVLASFGSKFDFAAFGDQRCNRVDTQLGTFLDAPFHPLPLRYGQAQVAAQR